jgi:hypothetical protein
MSGNLDAGVLDCAMPEPVLDKPRIVSCMFPVHAPGFANPAAYAMANAARTRPSAAVRSQPTPSTAWIKRNASSFADAKNGKPAARPIRGDELRSGTCRVG